VVSCGEVEVEGISASVEKGLLIGWSYSGGEVVSRDEKRIEFTLEDIFFVDDPQDIADDEEEYKESEKR